MCVCFGRVSLHCFNTCTPDIIYGSISSRCMGVASRWNYNGECMIKISRGGRGRDTFETPPPLRTTFAFTHPCFKMFLVFHCYLHSPSTTPSPPIKNVDHTLRCSAFYGVYLMSLVSVMFLYPSRNDGGPHRNCTLYTRVIRVPSAFLRKL